MISPMLGGLGKLHDRLTALGLALGATAIIVMIFTYWYEITARYFFAAPTTWASDVVAYLLSVSVFLIVPAVTRMKQHISVPTLIELLGPTKTNRLLTVLDIIGFLVCLCTAFMIGTENIREFMNGVTTMATTPIPKWWISAFATYGLASSGLYFLRSAIEGHESHREA